MKPEDEATIPWKRRIRRLRRRMDKTQAELAELLNVSTNTVSMWEQGLHEPQRLVQPAIEELEKETRRKAG